MVALQRQELLQDVTADLLGRTITSADTDIIGILCNANDGECLNQLSAENDESEE